MNIGRNHPTLVVCLLVLCSSFLWYVKFDSSGNSVLILMLSLFRYLMETALLGIASYPIVQKFIPMRKRARSNLYYDKIIHAPIIVLILMSGGIYVLFLSVVLFLATFKEVNMWMLFPVIFLSKLSAAVCIACVVTAILVGKKQTLS